MTPRRQPTPRPAARPLAEPGSRPEPDHPQAARLRWFLVAHVLAVLLIYAAAVMVGGGLASPPFPPDRPARAALATSVQPVGTPAALPVHAAPRDALVLPAAAPDVAAPWAAGPSRTE